MPVEHRLSMARQYMEYPYEHKLRNIFKILRQKYRNTERFLKDLVFFFFFFVHCFNYGKVNSKNPFRGAFTTTLNLGYVCFKYLKARSDWPRVRFDRSLCSRNAHGPLTHYSNLEEAGHKISNNRGRSSTHPE